MASIVVVGGIVSSVNHGLGFAAVVTAAGASLAHYATVLVVDDRRRVERMTAYGFHVGILAAIVFFLLDHTLG